MNPFNSICLFSIGLLSACTDPSSTVPSLTLLSGTTPFVLLVSNQSFTIDPVDVSVTIDGQPAVDQDFLVEGQHSWHRFEFSLANGSHNVAAASNGGGTSMSTAIQLESATWGVLNFWYDDGQPIPLLELTVYNSEPAFH